MYRDAHEHGTRLVEFAKNRMDEEFLDRLNSALAELRFPPAPGVHLAHRLPVVYIVGVPRSGTTLLSQLLSRYLQVGYINNLIARFWRRPSVGIRLTRILIGSEGRRLIECNSRYGVTEGVVGPHEFGYFWRYWLKLDSAQSHHLSSEELARLDRDGLRSALRQEILCEFGQPVVFKNVICGFHARYLSDLHPRSLFVHVRRNPFDAAASILNSRLARYGSYSTWWSLKPSTYPSLRDLTDPAEQVARQVTDCLAEFDAELRQPGVHSVQVNFADVCQRPEEVLKRICAELLVMGAEVHQTEEPMPRFLPPDSRRLDPSLERRLRQFLSDA